ncbi:pyruvate kinase [Chloroflexota bacterium]
MKYGKFSKRRTKIVCTLGPATNKASVIDRLIRAGMDIARINLSHGSQKEHSKNVVAVRRLSQKLKRNVALLIDVPGPKYRLGTLENGSVTLKKGAKVLLNQTQPLGNNEVLPVKLPYPITDIKKNARILLADGALELKVSGKNDADVICRVSAGGTIRTGAGFVVIGKATSKSFIDNTIRDHILFAISQKPDYLALSYVSNVDDIVEVKAILTENNANIPLIIKIERAQAIKNLDAILKISDGIMVARGDLGVELPLEMVPLVQKDIISKCNRLGIPVITATEMLESMVTSSRPTRAETTDVANAIFDGTDATMLSSETSIGSHPVTVVKMMAKIALQTEKKLPYTQMLDDRNSRLKKETGELISYNACHTAHTLGAAAIVAFTKSGSTAGRVSKYRPKTPILALTPSQTSARRLVLYWGVHTVNTESVTSVDQLFAMGANVVKDLGLGNAGDLVVITAGIPIGEAGSTNLLKVETIK